MAGIKKGKRVTKQELSDDKKYPVYSGGISPMGYFDDFNQEANTITIVKYGSAGFVNLIEHKFWANDVCYCVKPNEILNNKFLYYVLKNKQREIYSMVLTDAIPNHLPTLEISSLLIPIPPIRVQEEIVRILDMFSELISELSAELELRKKQYYYYREKLLTFTKDTAEFLPLGEVGEIIRGKDIQKKHLLSEGVPAIHYGQIYTHYGVYTDKSKSFVSEDFVKSNKLRLAPSGSLIVATTSENDEDLCKAVAWLGSNEVAISGDACFIIPQLNSKFLSYFFCTDNFREQKKKFISGTKVRRLNANDLAKIIIPIPPIAEQERIVSILDKFDSLVNSISEGIPAEINLRQKQYEYYRNALLSFN